jgi:hypothetical protein
MVSLGEVAFGSPACKSSGTLGRIAKQSSHEFLRVIRPPSADVQISS